MHVNATAASQKMIHDIIGPAYDICVQHGICAQIGEHQDDVFFETSNFPDKTCIET